MMPQRKDHTDPSLPQLPIPITHLLRQLLFPVLRLTALLR